MPRNPYQASGTSPTTLPEDAPTYWTVREVAAYFSVNQMTVRNWIDAGALHATRLAGTTLRIHRDEIDRFSAAGE